jgi:hypothetical protein
MNVCIALDRRGAYSQVFIDGNDITGSVRGVEVRAFAGEFSIVTLTLEAAVEITGEVGAVFKAPGPVSYEEAVKLGNAIVDAIVDKDAPKDTP